MPSKTGDAQINEIYPYVHISSAIYINMFFAMAFPMWIYGFPMGEAEWNTRQLNRDLITRKKKRIAVVVLSLITRGILSRTWNDKNG